MNCKHFSSYHYDGYDSDWYLISAEMYWFYRVFLLFSDVFIYICQLSNVAHFLKMMGCVHKIDLVLVNKYSAWT